VLRQIVAIAIVAVLTGLQLRAGDVGYHQRFADLLAKGTNGFVSDLSLVDANNLGPVLTNGLLPFSQFRQKGELAGIRLGMSMSEVVKAWGKPRSLATRCMIGPRFYYGQVSGQRVSLFFQEDRLVLIAIDGRQLNRAVFDNGLNGGMGSKQVEEILGLPSLRIAKQTRIYEGDIAFVAGDIRTDFMFTHVSRKPAYAEQKEELLWVAVGIESDINRNREEKAAKTNSAAPPQR
jgi:hypothetical protein